MRSSASASESESNYQARRQPRYIALFLAVSLIVRRLKPVVQPVDLSTERESVRQADVDSAASAERQGVRRIEGTQAGYVRIAKQEASKRLELAAGH